MTLLRKFAVEIIIVAALIAFLAYGYRRAAPSEVTAAAAAPVVQADLSGGPIAGTTSYAIDTITIDSVPYHVAGHSPSYDVAAGSSIDFSGWAVDAPAGRAAHAIAGAFGDAIVVGFSCGLPRPDVATALSNARYARSGFAGHIPPSTLRPGQYTLTLDVETASRSGYYRVATPISLSVR